MNRLLTSLFCLFFLFPVAWAQVGQPRSDFSIGISGGYCLNRVSFTPTVKKTYKGGVTFGLTARYVCEKYFSSICAVQAEVNYANMGWKEVIETSEDTYYRDMHYIQVPIFARLGWGREQRGLQFFVQAGPQLNYFLGDKEHRGGPWTEETLNLRPNLVTAQYGKAVERPFEYGLVGGGGLELSTGIGHFLVEGRYYFALSDIFNNGKKDPFGRSANGAIQIKATYLFDLVRTRR